MGPRRSKAETDRLFARICSCRSADAALSRSPYKTTVSYLRALRLWIRARSGFGVVGLVVCSWVECVDTLAGLGGEVMHSINPGSVEMRLPQRRLDIPRRHSSTLRNWLMSGRPGFIRVCTDIQSIAAPGLLHVTPGFAIPERGRHCPKRGHRPNSCPGQQRRQTQTRTATM